MEGISTPTREPKIDAVLEEILRTSPVIGTGRDGIVLRVDTSVSSDLSTALNRQEENYAVKILKVFKKGEAQKEYDAQLKAYFLMMGNEKFAKIPEPILCKVQHLSDADKNYLNTHGAILADDAEVIVMDYIDGKDLATIVYDYILHKNGFGENTLRNMSFEDKNGHVAALLNFQFSSQKDDFKELVANRDNLLKLVTYLRKTDFSIDPGILEKIQASVQMLEENGVFHNDLHERNIMIDKDGNPFIIDFGRSVRDRGDKESDDTALVKRFVEINKKADDIKKEKEEADKQNWERLVSKTKKNDIDAWKSFIDQDKPDTIKNFLLSYTSDTSRLERGLAVLASIIINSPKKKNAAYRSVTHKILSELVDIPNLPIFAVNKIKRFGVFVDSI